MSEWKETEIGRIPKYWEICNVDEIKSPEKKSIISGPFGSNISAKFFVEFGIPVIRGNNLSLTLTEKFKDTGFVFITEGKANELNTWAKLNDIVFTAVGTIGQVGIILNSQIFERYIISNKQLRLTVDEKKVLPLYAYYWFASPIMIDIIKQRNTGSSVPLINLSVLKSLNIPIPPLPEQKAIAEVLSSLDDKIDLLHRQNKTLEQMAETLFRQWFVEEAKEAWEDGNILDYAVHSKMSVHPKRNLEIEYYHYSIPSFDKGKNPVKEFGRNIQSNKYEVPVNCVLFSKLNPHKDKRVWLLQNEVMENSICSTEFQIVKPIKKIFLYFIYGWLSYNKNFKEIASGVGGTSGSHQRIDPSTIFEYKCPIVEESYIEEYFDQVESIFKNQVNNQVQICTIEKMRDSLLPKLMSGEIKLSEHD